MSLLLKRALRAEEAFPYGPWSSRLVDLFSDHTGGLLRAPFNYIFEVVSESMCGLCFHGGMGTAFGL